MLWASRGRGADYDGSGHRGRTSGVGTRRRDIIRPLMCDRRQPYPNGSIDELKPEFQRGTAVES